MATGQRTTEGPVGSPAGDNSSETSEAVDRLPVISNLWSEAYESLKTDEATSELIELCEQELSKQMDIAVSPERATRLQQMQDLAQAKIDEVEKGTWKVKVCKREFAVRDLMVPAVGVIGWAKEYLDKTVKSSRSLPASIAWVGICVLLPLILNPSEQSAAKVEALEKIASMGL